jgi:hypothetical protein
MKKECSVEQQALFQIQLPNSLILPLLASAFPSELASAFTSDWGFGCSTSNDLER